MLPPMADLFPELFPPTEPVNLTPREVVAPLILDYPLELALILDAATRKVVAAMPEGVLDGRLRVRSSLYWVRSGVPQSWHVDFSSHMSSGESLKAYQDRVDGHRSLLFAYDPLGVTTDFVLDACLSDLFDPGDRLTTPDVHERVCTGRLECCSVLPNQFVSMRPNQVHRRGFSAAESHFRRIVVFHDLESNGPRMLSPLERLTEQKAREAFKRIMRT